jgi:hypothetical protein
MGSGYGCQLMRGLVLAYHSQNCGGYDYSSNDHYAFQHDICTVFDYGLPVISLLEIATKISAQRSADLPQHFVAFSCDDGSLLDWYDYDHPAFGKQRSFANILRDQLSDRGQLDPNLLTSFVIASPVARHTIDQVCYEGRPLSNDAWWSEAASEGLLAIENHSWDHVHTALPNEMLQPGSAGNFYSIDSYAKADLQVRAASEFIDQRLAASGQRTSLFAYPYGHVSRFLSQEYLPRFQNEHGIVGAFTTEKKFIDAATPLYAIPRMVCGDAWRTPGQFKALLQQLREEVAPSPGSN